MPNKIEISKNNPAIQITVISNRKLSTRAQPIFLYLKNNGVHKRFKMSCKKKSGIAKNFAKLMG